MAVDYLAVAGLLLIAAGWVLQYKSMKGGKKDIKREFVGINCIGIALLVVSGYLNGAYDIAIMNALTFASSALVFSSIKK